MNRLEFFKRTHNNLKLVKDDRLHNALHKVSKTWYVFLNRARGKVEVHDVRLMQNTKTWTTHVMTENRVSWKIVHDAKRFNSRNYDVNEAADRSSNLKDLTQDNQMKRKFSAAKYSALEEYSRS